MRIFFTVIILFIALGLYAAPLERGYPLAPSAGASPNERAQAYINARTKVIEAAVKYLGTPYHLGGTSAAGMDCSGFTFRSFHDALGVSLPRSSSNLYTWTVRIPIESARPGDLVFFRTNGSRIINHVGLYIGNRRFIHAASAGARTGVIFSSLNEQYYISTFAGAGRAFPEADPFNVDVIIIPAVNAAEEQN